MQPHVDFGLKLLGADVMSIPGLYRFVQVVLSFQSKVLCIDLITKQDHLVLSYFCFSSLFNSLFLFSFFNQELIKEQVANMYLWPKVLEVQIMDPSK